MDKKIKYNLNYIKKNFDIKKLLSLLTEIGDISHSLVISCANKDNESLLRDIHYLINKDKYIYKIDLSDFSKKWKTKKYQTKHEYLERTTGIYYEKYFIELELIQKDEKLCENFIVKQYDKKGNELYEHPVQNLNFLGTLLPKISNNFKLLFYFQMEISPNYSESHFLIKSKINNTNYHFSSGRKWDKKKKRYVFDGDELYYFKKKIKTKIDFFEQIIKINKSLDRHTREMYYAKNGINYLDIYEKGKLK